MVDQIKDLMFQLNKELRTKYQSSKERLQQLDAKQLNQVLDQIIQYNDIQINLINKLEISSDNMINIYNQITQTIDQVNQYQQNQQEQDKVKELYQNAKQLCLDDDKYEESIKLLDSALLIDQNHLDSLHLKALCLYELSNYKDAIIWADKALLIYSNHEESLEMKGESLLELGEYEEALKYIDQALNCNPNSAYGLYLKG